MGTHGIIASEKMDCGKKYNPRNRMLMSVGRVSSAPPPLIYCTAMHALPIAATSVANE